ncbi:MAG: sulfotransferase [Acidobacteria bacterium]|nr:sulfotransferase [Acidobacteriota bacterium]
MTFFVVGSSRSGTTLLSVLLDRHPRLCVTPETAFYNDVAPKLWWRSERRLRRVLETWRRLPELGLDAESVVARVRGRRWRAGDVLRAILELYAEKRGKPTAGEKTPQHLAHLRRIFRDFPEAKALCMLRDGRDVALSIAAMPWGVPLRAAAQQWREAVQQMETIARNEPDRFRIVRYEKLAADPEGELRAIMMFLGEQFDARQLDAGIPSGVVLARSMEWKGQALQPVVAATRRGGTGEEGAMLEQLLAAELDRLGYFSGRNGNL